MSQKKYRKISEQRHPQPPHGSVPFAPAHNDVIVCARYSIYAQWDAMRPSEQSRVTALASIGYKRTAKGDHLVYTL